MCMIQQITNYPEDLAPECIYYSLVLYIWPSSVSRMGHNTIKQILRLG